MTQSSSTVIENATREKLPECEFLKHEDLFIKFIVSSCVGSVFAFIGIVGNSLNLLTLYFVSKQTANTLYLAHMFLCDVILSISGILLYGVEHVAEFLSIASLYSAWVTYLPYVYGIGHFAQSSGVGLLLLGCIERYLDVAYRRRFKNLLGSTKSAKRAIIASYILIVCITLPRFFEITSTELDCHGLGSHLPAARPHISSAIYQSVYSLWFSSVLLVVFPFMLIFVLSVLTISHIRTAVRRQLVRRKEGVGRKRSSLAKKLSWQLAVRKFYNRQRFRRAGSRRETDTVIETASTAHLSDPRTREVTTTFAAFVTVFLLSKTWSVVLTMLECTVGAAYLIIRVPLFYSASREAINLFAVLGPAMTFGIYFCLSREFRRDVAEFQRRISIFRIDKHAELVVHRTPTHTDKHSMMKLKRPMIPTPQWLRNVHLPRLTTLFWYRLIYLYRNPGQLLMIISLPPLVLFVGWLCGFILTSLQREILMNKSTFCEFPPEGLPTAHLPFIKVFPGGCDEKAEAIGSVVGGWKDMVKKYTKVIQKMDCKQLIQFGAQAAQHHMLEMQNKSGQRTFQIDEAYLDIGSYFPSITTEYIMYWPAHVDRVTPAQELMEEVMKIMGELMEEVMKIMDGILDMAMDMGRNASKDCDMCEAMKVLPLHRCERAKQRIFGFPNKAAAKKHMQSNRLDYEVHISGNVSLQLVWSMVDLSGYDGRTSFAYTLAYDKRYPYFVNSKLVYLQAPTDLTIDIYSSFLPAVIIFAFYYAPCYMAQQLALEKSLRLNEYLMLKGVGLLVQRLSWILVYVLISIPTAIICGIIVSLFQPGIFANTALGIIIFMLVLFVLAQLAFAAFLAAITSDHEVVGFVYLGCICLTLIISHPFSQLDYLNGNLMYVAHVVSLFCPVIPFRIGLAKIMAWEAAWLGGTWDRIWKTPISTDHFGGIAVCYCYLAANSVLYFVSSWYVTRVYPGKYGVALPLWFPFTSSYWNNNKGTRQQTSSDDVSSSSGIYLKRLTKKYGTNTVVNELEMEFRRGETTALLGENGAGKSTTISMIVGVLQSTSGQVYVGGQGVSGGSQCHDTLQYVPQYDILFPAMTMQDHIAFYGRLANMSVEETEEVAQPLLELFKIGHVGRIKATKLSGGQRRKLSLICALISQPKFLVLDEPTAGVDPLSRKQIWDAILDQKKRRVTVIISTHHLDEAEVLSDRIAIISVGKLRCFDTSMALKDRYSQGYKMSVVASDKDRHAGICTEVMRNLPDARVHKVVDADIIFSVPRKEAMGDGMVKLMVRFETDCSRMGVLHYGITEPTMDEVFFNAIGNVDMESENIENVKKNASNVYYERLRGRELLLAQYIGLIGKRFHYARRSRATLLLQVFVPLLFTVVMFLVGSVSIKMLGITEESRLVRQDAAHSEQILFITLSDLSSHSASTVLTDGRNLILELLSETARLTDDLPNCSCGETCYNQAIAQQRPMLFPQFTNNRVFHLPDVSNFSSLLFHFNDSHAGMLAAGARISFDESLRRKNLNLSVGLNALNFSGLTVISPLLHKPATLNIVNSALLKWVTRKQNVEIVYKIKPERILVEVDNVGMDIKLIKSMLPCVVNIVIVFVCLALGPLYYMLQEKEKGLKQYQFAVGVHRVMYIFANYTWDVVVVYIQTICIFCLIFPIPSPIRPIVPWLCLVFAGYGCAITAYAMFLTTFLKTFRSALAWIAVELIVMLIVCLLLTYLSFECRMYNMQCDIGLVVGNEDDPQPCETCAYASVPHVISVILNIFPVYVACEGSLVTLINYLLIDGFSDVVPQTEVPDENVLYRIVEILGYRAFRPGYLGLYPMATGASVLFFLSLCLLGDGLDWRPLLKKLAHLKVDRSSTTRSSSDCTEEDVDVEEEAHAVDDLRHLMDVWDGMEVPPLLVSSLVKTFSRMPRPAVGGVSFVVQKRQCFGLLGVNGAGKSTCFKMLTGYEQPDSGNAYICGASIEDRKNAVQLAGYCPQANILFDRLSVQEHLFLFSFLAGVPSDVAKNQLIPALVQQIGLTEYMEKLAGNLSGGNQRKLQLALAVMEYRPLIFMDEPTSGMDPGARHLTWKLIDRAIRDRNCSVVLTSHSLQECEELCHRIAVMVLGKIRCIGTVQYLKDKMGNKYSIKFRLAVGKQEAAVELERYMAKALHGRAKLIDKHDTLLVFQISRNSLRRLSDLFRVVRVANQKFPIEGYTISQATLEDVFVKYAAQAEKDTPCVSDASPRSADVSDKAKHDSITTMGSLTSSIIAKSKDTTSLAKTIDKVVEVAQKGKEKLMEKSVKDVVAKAVKAVELELEQSSSSEEESSSDDEESVKK